MLLQLVDLDCKVCVCMCVCVLQGDSGGPLVYKSNTIIGVVSGISIGCNENNEPGIYCRVSAYIEFIKNAMMDITDGMRVKTFEN